jgi:divalent metal cation (Fe/Co/Zn/Cd) transporter
MMFDKKVFNIAFIDAVFDDEREKMVNELEKIPGVHDATPDLDPERNFHGISIRVNKNMDLSDILEVIRKSGLKIRDINTKEPTLEEAFMAITGQQQDQPPEPRSYRGRS